MLANRNNIKGKLSDKGKPCVWIGYARNHADGTHRVHNPETKKIFLIRDIIFLPHVHNEWERRIQKLRQPLSI